MIIMRLTFTTVIIGQIPKRFFFRQRPHMQFRAIKFSNDQSSSFPSRGVTSAFIYSAGICYCADYMTQQMGDDVGISDLTYFVSIFTLTIFQSFSRVLLELHSQIYVGAHFPSDCIFGILQGCICLTLTYFEQSINIFQCYSCYKNQCYKSNDFLDVSDYPNKNLAIKSTILWLLLFIFIQVKPLQFWEKSASFIGSIGAIYTANLILACKNSMNDQVSRHFELDQLEFEDYSYALIIAGANWGALEIFTKIVRRLEKKNYPHIFRVNLIAYFTFYFSFLLMIVNFRA